MHLLRLSCSFFAVPLCALLVQLKNALARGVDDASIAARYNEKKLELDEREAELIKEKLDIEHMSEGIAEITNKWRQRIEKMIGTINKQSEQQQTRSRDNASARWLTCVRVFLLSLCSFSEYFKHIRCEGCVELQTAPTFGILIKVSFRKGQEMRPLSGSSQSGGEKSVSTMLYLLCLQEVTNAPFRMADEINH
jgi:uncharacterized protein YeeX (DUF496 family)